MVLMKRWASCYLMPNESRYQVISAEVWQNFGSGTQAALKATDLLLSTVGVNLLCWRHEAQLAERSCDLISSLCKNRAILPSLQSCPSWNAFLTALLAEDSPIHRLPSELVGRLVSRDCSVAQRVG